MLIFWIYSGLNRVSVKRTGESTRKSLFFNIFTHRFSYFEIKIANTKTPKIMLTEYIPSVLSGHMGVIRCRIKEC